MNDVIGRKFGLLTVMGDAPERKRTVSNPNFSETYRRVVVRCDCGTEFSIDLRTLNSNRTLHCQNCYGDVSDDQRRRWSNNGWSPIFGTNWNNLYGNLRFMVERSGNPAYAGKSFDIESPEALKAAMPPRPSPDHVVGLASFRGPVAPDNLVWFEPRRTPIA